MSLVFPYSFFPPFVLLSNVGIICFAASYLVAFALEVSRFFFRSGFRGVVMFGFAAAGWIAHSAYLYHQIVLQNGHLFDSVQGWLFAVAWALAIFYLYLVVYFPKTPFGLFLLPLILISIIAGTHYADASPFPVDSVGQTWRIIHGAAFLLATVVIFLGFVTGVMYLVQMSNLKHKRPMLGRWRLPTLEWLQTTNSRLIGFLVIALAIGIMSGFAINSLNMRGQRHSVSLFDPMVLVTIAMFVFLLLFVATAFGARAREGQRLAVVTVICFAAMIVMLTFGVLSSTSHWNIIVPQQTEHDQNEGNHSGTNQHRPDANAESSLSEASP